MVERKRVYVPRTMKQRGSGKEIDRENAAIFDFMPVLLGEEFRTNDILNRQLFRDPPVSGPMMLAEEAYTLLGKKYLKEKNLVPALECYKFALNEQTSFIDFISSIQDSALLTTDEISHLNLGSSLETSLIKKLSRSKKDLDVDMKEYVKWLESLHALQNQYNLLNEKIYSLEPFNTWYKKNGILMGCDKKTKKWLPVKGYPFSKEFKDYAKQYIDICIRRGEFDEAINFAEYFETSFQRKIRSQIPKEILDVKWLNKYIDDNHPLSSMEY